MNVQQLFEAIGNIDDQYITEAASDAVPHARWKIAALAAAAAAVIAGTVWFSSATLNRPTPTPQDLAAPTATIAPAETAQPAPDTSAPVSVAPEGEGSVEPPAQPTPTQPEGSGGNSGGLIGNSGSGGSGSGLPGFGGQGAGLPGSGGSETVPDTPQPTPTQYHYLCRYSHSAAGDYLIFCEPFYGVPVYVKNITGQIVDGYYSTTVTGLPFGAPCHVELHVYEDGSYDLNVS